LRLSLNHAFYRGDGRKTASFDQQKQIAAVAIDRLRHCLQSDPPGILSDKPVAGRSLFRILKKCWIIVCINSILKAFNGSGAGVLGGIESAYGGTPMADQTDMATVLLVEDNESLRDVLYCTLYEAGYRVSTAHNGQQALEMADNTSFDVVVTDILMPEVDGLELIAELTARNQSCRIIAMTGGGSMLVNTIGSLSSRHADVFGTHHTLKKPFHPDELLDVLEAVLSAEPAQPAN
jgi:CheY-like chemotaxis protein